MAVGERFEGKVALVTGGASGIGAAIVRRLIAEGASVGVVDLATSSFESLDELDSVTVFRAPADVTVESEMARAAQDTADHFGRLDIVVNAAGIAGGVVPITDADYEVWRRVLDTNLGGTFLGIKHGARAIQEAGNGGVIINIASINSVQPGHGLAAYSASKAGVAMLTKVAALDLAPHGIRVLAIGPGVTETPMTARSITSDPQAVADWLAVIPLERFAQTDDIASMVSFLASDEAGYVTGTTTYVDGGSLLRSYPRRGVSAPPPLALSK